MPPKRPAGATDEDDYVPELDETTTAHGDGSDVVPIDAFTGYSHESDDDFANQAAIKSARSKRPMIYDGNRDMEANGTLPFEQNPVKPYGFVGDKSGDNRRKFQSAREEYEKKAIQKMQAWKKGRGVTEVQGTTLEELQKRPRSDKDAAAAQDKMEAFEERWNKGEAKAWATSRMWRDCNGKFLAASFSWRHAGDTYDPDQKHEVSVNDTIQHDGMVSDGLEPDVQEYIALETQHEMHYIDVKKTQYVDKRHRTDGRFAGRYGDHYTGIQADRIRFSSERPPVNQDPSTNRHMVHDARKAEMEAQDKRAKQGNHPQPAERELGPSLEYVNKVGAVHYDRCWPEQGHGKQKLTKSTDLSGGASFRTEAASRYMSKINTYIQDVTTPYMATCATPKKYRQMRKAFRAAATDKEEEDGPGFHTGQVVVYNEVLHQHLDGADAGLCLTFCTGSKNGGLMYFPDLDEAIVYDSGTVLVFCSALLYHGVTSWTPAGNITINGLFPGRVGYVLYTKKEAFDRLVTMKPGGMRNTAFQTATEPPPSSYIARGESNGTHKAFGAGAWGTIVQESTTIPKADRLVTIQPLQRPTIPPAPKQTTKRPRLA